MKSLKEILEEMQQIGNEYGQGGNANEVLTDIVPYLIDTITTLANSNSSIENAELAESIISEYHRIVS